MFRLITKYCNNLREIYFPFNRIIDENIEEFQQKFGPKINFIHRLKDANNYNLFPNIKKLDTKYYNSDDFIPRLKLKKLKKFKIRLNDGEEHVIQTCVDTFPTLTHFMQPFLLKITPKKVLQFIGIYLKPQEFETFLSHYFSYTMSYIL